MKRLTFKRGGIHPPPEKELASSGRYQPLPMPELLTIPMAQHLGSPAKVAVKKKAKLAAGDLLGEPGGFVSAGIHAPVDGQVKLVERIAMGPAVVDAVTLTPEAGAEAWPFEPDPPPLDLRHIEPAAVVERVKAAGLVGMGGATFPTHVKLSPPKDTPIDTVILNGAECEPYLTADDCLMRNHPRQVVQGARAAMHALGAASGYIGVEDNKPLALERLAAEASEVPEIQIVALRTQYPQGSEKQLIEACTGRRVEPGKLPFSAGVAVQNVGTAAAIYEAVALERPLVRRLVTVSGRAVRQPANLLVPIGAPIQALVDCCGGHTEELAAVVMGGPMMGRTTTDWNAPVTKGTSGLLLLTTEEIPVLSEDPCLRCGRCVGVCPMGLVPCHLEKLISTGRFDEATDAMDCVECGCCAYICPADRRLVHRFRLAKWEIGRRRRREQQKQKAG